MRFIVLSECVFYRLSVYTHRLYRGRFLYSTFGLGSYFDVVVLRFLALHSSWEFYRAV
jgi:hypothetical protein